MSVRTFKNAPDLIAVGWTELDAANQHVGTIRLRRLFEGCKASWARVDDEMEKRAANREAVSATRSAGDGHTHRRERVAIRERIFERVNAKVAARLATEDAERAAVTALVAALPPPPPETSKTLHAAEAA